MVGGQKQGHTPAAAGEINVLGSQMSIRMEAARFETRHDSELICSAHALQVATADRMGDL